MEKTLHSRYALVTGFTSGIGLETTRILAQNGWHVIGIARSPERARHTVEILRAQTGNPHLTTKTADLSSTGETRALAETLLTAPHTFDLLIHNAGALFRKREETAEGIEKTFALNHLAPFLLTRTLLPKLTGRIVTLTSAAHHGITLDPDDLGMKKHYNGWIQYRRTKLMNILFTRELARRLPGPACATCLHPGFVDTRFGMNNKSFPLGLLWCGGLKLMMLLSALSPQDAAKGVFHVATHETLRHANGQYFDRGHPAAPSLDAQNDLLARALWEKSELLCESIQAPEGSRNRI